MPIIYKILPEAMWLQAQKDRVFRGSEVDLRDGFIHFSTASQAVETAAKHFAGQRDLVLLYVDTERLGKNLKWEPSRGGALFPHLYGDLALTAVTKAARPCRCRWDRTAPINFPRSRIEPCFRAWEPCRTSAHYIALQHEMRRSFHL